MPMESIIKGARPCCDSPIPKRGDVIALTLIAAGHAMPSRRLIIETRPHFVATDRVAATTLSRASSRTKLGELFGQQFIVDNRPGAGGFIGQSFVVKAPADGYTLLLGGGSMAGARYVNAAVTYDVLRDFTHISLVETSPFVLVVHPSVPARNLKEYIALARSKPGKMTFATIGADQIPYWAVILFNNMAGIKATEIRYK